MTSSASQAEIAATESTSRITGALYVCRYAPAMRPWRRVDGDVLFRHPLLALERQRVAAAPGEQRDALVLHAPDWVNVVPLLADGRVVMVRQWRYGVAAPTLELPGGVVDPGESPRDAALRELHEE